MALTTFTVDLPTEVAERLARKAARQGQDVSGLLRQPDAREAEATPIWDAATLAKWDALLDSFREGEEDDHRDTVSALAQALNEDRPGQRRVFGVGTNPKSAGR